MRHVSRRTTVKLRTEALIALFATAATFIPVTAYGQRTVRDAARALLAGSVREADIDSVATVLALQIATFPVGSSSGGFTLMPDPADPKSYKIKKTSFGPFFAERASTLGAKFAYSLGVNAQSTRFVEFEGNGLRNGDLASTAVIDNRLVELNKYTFDVSTQTTSVVATVGLRNDLDVGVIVPIVRTSLSGTSSILRPTGQRMETIVDVTNSGIGDVTFRGKWNFYPRPVEGTQVRAGAPGLAALVDVSVPTGDEERLSTTGRWRVRPMLVASADFGGDAGFAPHANLGYTFGGPGVTIRDQRPLLPEIVTAEAGDEINYVVGAEAWPSPVLTVFVDLIGRALRNIARFDAGRRTVEVPGFGPLEVGALVAREGTLNVRLAAVGARVQVLGKGLISASLLFPLNTGGVRPGLTPVIGFEYAFGSAFQSVSK
jgi:hypothetical protein